MSAHKLLQGIILCFHPLLLIAQVELKVVPDKRSARVGDIISLRVEAKVPSGTSVKWAIPDSIPHWEWVDKGMDVPVSTGSIVSFSFNCRFIGYDTGYWPIPPIKLIAGNQTFVVDTFFVQVNYANSDLSLPFRDTKSLMELPEAAPSRTGWFIGFGLMLLMTFVFYLFYKRKQKGKKFTVPVGMSIAYFLQQLQILEAEYQSGNLMGVEFYERWVEILRKYIRWQTGKISIDQGTSQIVESLKSTGLQEEIRENLGACLLISEKARFACHQPDDATNKNALRVLKTALEAIHQNT